MNKVLTILLGLLALAAIIFLAIYEPLTRSRREYDMAARDGSVLRIDPSRIQEIRISSADSSTVLKRRGNSWQLGSKSKDRADTEIVKRLLKAAAELQFFDRVDASEIRNDKDMSDYGLRTPKRKIEFKGDGDVTLFFGKDAANEQRLYVRTDKTRDIYLVSDELLNLAFEETSAFRDRRLTDLSPDQVDRFVIRRAGGEIELVRDATGWRIVKPIHALADAQKVDDYLKRLLDLHILEYVGEDTGDLGIYGLAEGQNEISIFADGSDRHQTLRLGTDNSGVLFGQFTARDSVYRMPVETQELLQATPDSLRDRRLLPLNLDVVDLIKIRSPQNEFSLRRQGEEWELQEEGVRRPASAAAVRNLADAVSIAKVSGYSAMTNGKLSDYGLDPAACTVEFLSVLSENTPEARAGEQSIARLTFGQTTEDKIFVRLDDIPEVMSVPADILKSLPLDPAAWVSPK
jgi:hypothetical protein